MAVRGGGGSKPKGLSMQAQENADDAASYSVGAESDERRLGRFELASKVDLG